MTKKLFCIDNEWKKTWIYENPALVGIACCGLLGLMPLVYGIKDQISDMMIFGLIIFIPSVLFIYKAITFDSQICRGISP